MTLSHPDAEAATIGALLLNPAVLANVRPLLPDPSHFTTPQLAALYKGICNLSDRGATIDHITVSVECPGLEDVAHEAVEAAVGTGGVLSHAALLAEATLRRRTTALAERLVARCKDPDLKLGDTLAGMVGELAKLGEGTMKEKPKSLAASLADVVEGLGKPPDHGDTNGFPSGLRKLDDILDGFKPGKLHVIAGNPSEGKSSLARWIARRAAEHTPVWFNSLEMGQDELAEAWFVSEIGYTTKWIGADPLRLENFYPKIMEASSRLASLPITVAEGVYTPAAVKLAFQAESAQGRRPGMVVLDYLQLMRCDGRQERRDLEIGSITSDLKQWALREKISVVLLSQFSRENKKMGRKPRLDDLRESGNIEQDADTVTAIYLPHGLPQYEPNVAKSWIVDLLVLKNRGGPTGFAQVSFEPWTYKFREDLTP